MSPRRDGEILIFVPSNRSSLEIFPRKRMRVIMYYFIMRRGSHCWTIKRLYRHYKAENLFYSSFAFIIKILLLVLLVLSEWIQHRPIVLIRSIRCLITDSVDQIGRLSSLNLVNINNAIRSFHWLSIRLLLLVPIPLSLTLLWLFCSASDEEEQENICSLRY